MDIIMPPESNKARFYEYAEPVVYTTGAYIQPIKIIKQDGREVWLWVVSEFDGDSFWDGNICHPQEYGDTKYELLAVDDEIV